MRCCFPFARWLLVWIGCGLTALGQQAAPEARLALIMGVGDYDGTQFPTLPGIEIDLQRMEKALRGAGFATTVVMNPTLGAAEEAIENFGRKLKAQAGGVGLFYFSGHGGELEGKNYLIPKSPRISGIRDLKEQAVAVQRVLSRMEEAGAPVNIVFLDCCRNDLTKGGGSSGLAPMSAKGTFIGFATASEKTSAASSDGSPYTTFLAQRLVTPGIGILEMHTRVTADVEDFTKAQGAEQTPFQYSGLRSNFVFVPGGTKKPEGEERPPLKVGLRGNTPGPGKKPGAEAPAVPGEARAFTRMSYHNLPTRSVVELESSVGGKRIPLSGKRVSASLQFKDGPLTPLQEVISDAQGIAQIAKPETKGKPGPLYLVFKFAGDPENRPAECRFKIR